MRTAAVNALNMSLLADLAPVDAVRGLGLRRCAPSGRCGARSCARESRRCWRDNALAPHGERRPVFNGLGAKTCNFRQLAMDFAGNAGETETTRTASSRNRATL